jgi:hypothetical protein
LWGFLKSEVYREPVDTLHELKEKEFVGASAALLLNFGVTPCKPWLSGAMSSKDVTGVT